MKSSFEVAAMRGLIRILFLLMPALSFAQQYRFETFSVEEGLAQSQIAKIFQDSQGYLWLGTYGGGVSRYNGLTFTNYSTKEGLVNNIVYDILEDHQGNLWFATEGGVCKYDGSAFVRLTDSEFLDNQPILALLEDRQRHLWLGTRDHGVVEFDGSEFSTYTTEQGLCNNTVCGILQDREGNLWIGTEGGISKFDGSTFVNFTEVAGTAKPSVWSMLEDRKGSLWFGTEGDGLLEYDGHAFKRYTTADGLGANNVRAIAQDGQGNLWFGTDHGVSRFDGCDFTTFTSAQGLSNDQIRSIVEDREGNLWFGTWGGGLDKFAGSIFAHFSTRQGLSSNLVMSILGDRSGVLWFGTWGGGVNKYEHGKFTSITTREGLADNGVFSILQDRKGNVWFGTAKGLSRFDGVRLVNFTTENGLANNLVNIIFEDHQGNLWIGTRGGGVSKFDGKTFTNFTSKDGLASDNVFSIFEDQQGTLWFGTWGGGICKYDGVKFTAVPTQVDLKSNVVLAILQDKPGALWFGTYGKGVLKYNVDRNGHLSEFDSFTTDDGLSDDAVLFMIFDDNENLWIGTNKGLNKLDRHEYYKTGRKVFKHYGKEKGFIGIECNRNAAFKDKNGCLWFGTIEGAMRYNPASDKPNTVEPLTHITNLRLFFEPVDWAQYARKKLLKGRLPAALRLPYDKNHVTFDFIGISLTIPAKVTYRYLLQGFDANWMPITQSTSATYSNLPPGDYTFKVQAANDDGVWNSEPATYHFTITPPFWRTWWFYVLAVVLSSGGILFIVRVRTKSLEAQRVRLELEVNKRTSELKKEKEKVERINAELEKLSLVASGTDNGVIIADATGKIEWVNAGFTRMNGYTLEALKRFKGETLIQISANPEIAENIEASIRNRASVIYESINETREGKRFWVSSTLTPIFDEHGQLKKLVVIDTDITERKETERALLESQTRLKLLNSMATDLSAGMSVDQIIERTTRLIHQHFKNYRVAYSTLDEGGKLKVIHSIEPDGMTPISGSSVDLKIAQGYLHTLQSSKSVIVENVKDSESLAPLAAMLLSVGTQALLDVPVAHNGKLVGLLCFDAPEPHTWSEHEITTLTEIAEYLTILLNDAAAQEERLRAEKALRESEQKYHALFDQIADPIFIFDKTSHHFLDCNKAVLRIYGYTREELQTMTPIDLHPEDELEKVRRTIDVKNVDAPITYTHLTKAGKRIAVEILSDEIQYQGRPAWISIVRDVSERQRAEEEAKKFVSLVENSSDFIGMAALDGKAIYVNPAGRKLVGLSSIAEVLTTTIPDYQPEETRRRFRDFVLPEVMKTGYWEGEAQLRHFKTGKPIDVQVSVFLVRHPQSGEPMCFATVQRDITERKRAEAEMRNAKEAAEEATRAKSEFLANMSHEIRTPLNAIIGMTELTLETSLTAEQQEFLNVVQSSSEALLGLINDILDFSKIEAGQMELEETSFDFQEVVEGVTDILGVRAAAKGLEILCYVDTSLSPRVIGDPTRLRQVLVNLMGNAIKFTEQGEVVIKVVPASEKQRKNGRQKETQLHFMVSDTGIGLTREQQSRVFEKFAQADSSTTRNFGGTGLGLSISKSLVELMGGRMWLESEVGRGSTFHFTLTFPLDENGARGKVKYSYPDFQKMSILVVDDNATNRYILRKTLTSWGFKVAEAAGGVEALTLLRKRKSLVDLIILDHQMPGMDGLELAREIRKDARFRGVKMILLSSWDGLSAPVQQGLGIAKSITKPVKQSKLFNILMQVFRIREIDSSAGRASDQTTGEVRTGRCFRILLVEDNADNQNLARRILEKSGYCVDLAENGQWAVEAAERFHYDLILMDIQMPVMDGFTATQAIRQWQHEHQEERTPIIALTAHALEGYREKCLNHDMDDYLTKPLKKGVLLETLSQWIDPRPTILVVDDSVDNRNLIRNYLKKESSYKVVFAENGQEAVEVFQRRSVALILLDMEMPVMDGYTAAAAIRDLHQGKKVAIVALTAHRGKREVHKCLEAGCTDYLSKPVRKQGVLEVLHRYLRKPDISVEVGTGKKWQQTKKPAKRKKRALSTMTKNTQAH